MHAFRCALVVLFLFAASGCSNQLGPSSEQLEKLFVADLPKQWTLSSFSVEVTETVGTKTEPVIKSRYKAVIALKEKTYTYVNHVDNFYKIRTGPSKGKIVGSAASRGRIKLTKEPGYSLVVYGISSSFQRENGWVTVFENEKNLKTIVGKPRSAYVKTSIIIASAEEKQYFAATAKAKAVDEKALKIEHDFFVKVFTSMSSGGAVYSGGYSPQIGLDKKIILFDIKFSDYSRSKGTFSGVKTLRDPTGKREHASKIRGKLSGTSLIFKDASYLNGSSTKGMVEVIGTNFYSVRKGVYILNYNVEKNALEGAHSDDNRLIKYGIVAIRVE